MPPPPPPPRPTQRPRPAVSAAAASSSPEAYVAPAHRGSRGPEWTAGSPEEVPSVSAAPTAAVPLTFREELDRKLAGRGNPRSHRDEPETERASVSARPSLLMIEEPDKLIAYTAEAPSLCTASVTAPFACAADTWQRPLAAENSRPKLPSPPLLQMPVTQESVYRGPPRTVPSSTSLRPPIAYSTASAASPSSPSTPRSSAIGSFMDGPMHELLYTHPGGVGQGVQLPSSRFSVGSFDGSSRQGYTTWQRKNLEGELQMTLGELREARANAARLDEELRSCQKDNLWLRRRLDVQCDRDELLRDLCDRVSEGDTASIVPRQRRICGTVCAILGRQ